MSFIIGKLSRKVSKQHKEYFVGKIGVEPVRAAWTKNGQDDYVYSWIWRKLIFSQSRIKKKEHSRS